MSTKVEKYVFENTLPYTITRTERSRTVRLSVYHDGRFAITAPKQVSLKIIQDFITQKYSWIQDKLHYFSTHPKTYLSFPKKNTRKEYLEYKETTRILVHDRLEYFNKQYNFTYKRVSIKNTKSRWGSCSKLGNLNFSYKLALLPKALADYVVVHELCHLAELNHSPNFWDLVGEALPNYKHLRSELKNII